MFKNALFLVCYIGKVVIEFKGIKFCVRNGCFWMVKIIFGLNNVTHFIV